MSPLTYKILAHPEVTQLDPRECIDWAMEMLELGYESPLMYWAWDQIDYDDTDQNHYWEGTNKKNIADTVVRVAVDWVDRYKGRIEDFTVQGK